MNRSQSYSANSDFGDHRACVFRFSNAFVTTVNIVMLVLMSLSEATFVKGKERKGTLFKCLVVLALER